MAPGRRLGDTSSRAGQSHLPDVDQHEVDRTVDVPQRLAEVALTQLYELSERGLLEVRTRDLGLLRLVLGSDDHAVLDLIVAHGGYRAYLSVGHDEYWSERMRDSVEAFVDAGGNAAFFSGNTSFWQVRFEDDYTKVVGYKLALEDDPVYGTDRQHTLSTMWCDPLVGRPENRMTGVSFTRGGYAHMPNSPQGTGGYTIWRPEHWAFSGLALRAGDQLGAEPVVVGYECDGCELTLRDGLPVPTGRDDTPPDFAVLGTAPAHLWETSEGADGLPDSYVGELNWVAERLAGADTPENRARFAHGRAVMGSFRRGRGEVFTTGCTDWAYGLEDPGVARVTENVLRRFTGPGG